MKKNIPAILVLVLGAIVISYYVEWMNSPAKIVDLEFEAPENCDDADNKTIASIKKIDKFYTLTCYGNYEDQLKWLDEFHVRESHKTIGQARCSLYAAYTDSGELLYGRNFDSDDYPVLARYGAEGKYASFGFAPWVDSQFEQVKDNSNPTEKQRNAFLYSLPFYTTGGINEKGLTISIAGAPIERVVKSDDKKSMFVLLFVRRVLDECKDVQEVAELARTITLYDSSYDKISHHFIAADADGNWLVIDYPKGKLRLTFGKDKPVIRTNHFVEGGESSPFTVTSFLRYNILNNGLNSSEPLTSMEDAMQQLKLAKGNTAWSVVYNTKEKCGLLAVKEKYRKLYRFSFD